MNKRQLSLMLLILVTIGFIGSIFMFSSQTSDDSMALSKKALNFYYNIDDQFKLSEVPLSQGIKHFIIDILFQGQYREPEALIRKLAHFSLYFALGALCVVLFDKLAHGARFHLGIAWLIGTTLPSFIAVLDETFQILSRRTASLQDVFLDTLGGIAGACICALAIFMIRIIIFNKPR